MKNMLEVLSVEFPKVNRMWNGKMLMWNMKNKDKLNKIIGLTATDTLTWFYVTFKLRRTNIERQEIQFILI